MTLSMSFRQGVVGLLTLSLSVLPPPARALFGAGDIVYDPANYAQNVLTAVRALQSNLNEAAQIANQLQQIEMDVKNLASFPASAWNTVQADLNQLKQLAKSSGEIGAALQTLSAQFKQLYPGYQAPTNYEQDYQQWTHRSLEGLNKALEAAAQQSQQLQAESDNTQELANLSRTAGGHLQALQAGNMIALQLVDQLQALRHLQVMETQAQNLYMASQLQNQAEEKAAIKRWLDSDIGYQSKM